MFNYNKTLDIRRTFKFNIKIKYFQMLYWLKITLVLSNMFEKMINKKGIVMYILIPKDKYRLILGLFNFLFVIFNLPVFLLSNNS